MTTSKLPQPPCVDAVDDDRATAGPDHQDPAIQPVRSDEVLRAVASRFWRHPAARDRRIELASDHEPAPLQTDPLLLGQVLGHLLEDGLLACPEGGTVTLGCGRCRGGVWFAIHTPVGELDVSLTETEDQDVRDYWPGVLCREHLGGRIELAVDPTAGLVWTVTLPVGGP